MISDDLINYLNIGKKHTNKNADETNQNTSNDFSDKTDFFQV